MKAQKASTTPLAPQTPVADLMERFKDYPNFDVISRRLLDPNDPGSLPILLKDEAPQSCINTDHQRILRPGATKCHLCKLKARKWHVHYCNSDIPGRWSTMKAKGYLPVLVNELADTEDVADLHKQQEETGQMYVRRGDRGREILMKIPLEIYTHVKTAQADRLRASMKNTKALRAELAERAGAELGDEAGEYIHRGGVQVESMTRERTTLGQEAGEE